MTTDFRALCAELVETWDATADFNFNDFGHAAADIVDRARADLATPPPEVLRPIPVSERLPGPGEWVWHCYIGVRFWIHGRYNGRQFFIGDGPKSQPATHWLPANALPHPEVTQ